MTTTRNTANQPKPASPYRLPDIPEKHPDDMTSFNHLGATGNAYHLSVHLGNPETTIVSAEHYIVPEPPRRGAEMRYPDLLVAFNADPELYKLNNGYIISEQGKPPDFVLEIASPRTAGLDTGRKRDFYAELGITEYWRFDETGNWHKTKLAGDRLGDGGYVPIPIEELEDGALQGYSEVLNLYLRWEQSQLVWHDSATGRRIATLEDERSARLQAEDRASQAEAELRELRRQLNQQPGG